jgi:hypothetical protein
MRVVFGLVLASLVAGGLGPARAEQWCGFIHEANERVRCGYSSLQQCQQALADTVRDKKKDTGKGIVCLPDPANG